MSTSTLLSASRFVSIAIVTCVLVTGGMWVAKHPSKKANEPSNFLSPAHWMFWLAGRDFDEELRNPEPWYTPTPWFESGRSVVPAWKSGEISDFSRYMKDEQDKRDQLMEDIRSRWGS